MDLLEPPLQALIMISSSMTLSLILQPKISVGLVGWWRMQARTVRFRSARCRHPDRGPKSLRKGQRIGQGGASEWPRTDLDASLAVAELLEIDVRLLAAETFTDGIDKQGVRGPGEDAGLAHGACACGAGDRGRSRFSDGRGGEVNRAMTSGEASDGNELLLTLHEM